MITTLEQHVVLVELGSKAPGHMGPPMVLEGIGDTGATRMLMDIATARCVGIPVSVAKGVE